MLLELVFRGAAFAHTVQGVVRNNLQRDTLCNCTLLNGPAARRKTLQHIGTRELQAGLRLQVLAVFNALQDENGVAAGEAVNGQIEPIDHINKNPES